MDHDVLEKRIWHVFRQILKLDDAFKGRDLNRRTLAQWDSLAHVNLLLALDVTFQSNLFSQAKTIHSFEDLVRAVSRKGSPSPPQKKIKRICFIGNCHAYLLFQAVAASLRSRRAPYQALYHHVDHILQYIDRNAHLDRDRRQQALSQDAGDLASGFQHYLDDAHMLVVSQIFQMEVFGNIALVNALAARFPGRIFLVPMAVPKALSGATHLKARSFYTGEQYLTPHGIRERCPNVQPLDATGAMDAFYQANGSLSFFTHTAKDEAGHYELDLTHPQPVFWKWFGENVAMPVLLAEPGSNAPVPQFLRDLKPGIQAIEENNPNGFNILAAASAPNSFVDEALKQLWRSHAHLRFPIMLSSLNMKERPKLCDLFRQMDWCHERDIHFTPEQAQQLDEELVRETRHFKDDVAIHRCVLALILLYQWHLKNPNLPLTASHFMDEHLFQREFVFNKRQRFLGNANAAVSPQARACLRRKVLELLNGETRWMLYGAGTLSSHILSSLMRDDPQPMAVVSGYEREWQNRFEGLPIVSPTQASDMNPGLVLEATRSWYYREITAALSQHHLKSTPFFQFPLREMDPVGGHTLAARLSRASFSLTWHDGQGSVQTYTLRELLLWGRAMAGPLVKQKGQVIPIVLPTSPAVFALFYYCLMEGALPTLLSYPTNRRNPQDYRKQIEAVTQNLGADVLICDRAIAEMLGEGHGIHEINGLLTPHWEDERPFVEPDLNPDDLAFLQHSSGTTGIQKTVPITHRQALRQLDAYGRALEVGDQDVIASWLPLYHDMGLITSLLGPPLWGAPVAACDPVAWVEQPGLILDIIQQHRATLAWWPNFTFAFLARAPFKDIDLSSIRMLVNCSEPVTNEAFTAFLHKGVSCGLKAQTLSSCYAMAETTFAVSQTPPGRSPLVLKVDSGDLARGLARPVKEGTRTLVSSGVPLDISNLVILDEKAQPLPHCRIGEICIASSSLFDGYLDQGNWDKSAFCRAGYRTGDLGFLWQGDNGVLELFVTGRKKDLIIIAGENHYPQDLERVAETVDGVKTGRSVAFGAFDPAIQTETLVIAVEEARPLKAQQRERVSTHIRQKILEAFGLKVTHALVYPVRSMIKSSAGKISRKASRLRILNDLGWEGPRD